MIESITFFDALYGERKLSRAISSLAQRPIVQRLRDIRLSNIDSLAMPGVSNISRYEHSLGVAILANQLALGWHLNEKDSLILEAAALLHDSAIPPCGHLVEEALNYLAQNFEHEKQWQRLLEEESVTIGGLDLQVYHGRQAGLRGWAEKEFKADAEAALTEIVSAIHGRGTFGPILAGQLDIDNLDNVVRAAFHIGLTADTALPLRVCQCIHEVRGRVFMITDDCVDDLLAWLNLRTELYQRFMLSRIDFVGKAMIIYATIEAVISGQLESGDWILTDRAYLQRLLDMKDSKSKRAIEMWLCHELWPLSDLLWFDGKVPSYPDLFAFNSVLSERLGRPCFAYRIKDKRYRKIDVTTDSGKTLSLGSESKQWLLGVVSPVLKHFSKEDNRRIIDTAIRAFRCECIGKANESETEAQQDLLFEMV